MPKCVAWDMYGCIQLQDADKLSAHVLTDCMTAAGFAGDISAEEYGVAVVHNFPHTALQQTQSVDLDYYDIEVKDWLALDTMPEVTLHADCSATEATRHTILHQAAHRYGTATSRHTVNLV